VDFLFAFLIGGLLCVAAQLVLELTSLTPAHVMVLFVSLGAVVSGLGLYQPLVDLGGAGATIPLPGFGHALVQGILKAISQEGALGLLTGGFTATAAGISVAILASWVAALLFDPKS
jgi:stage V sporulation protein AE